MLLFQIPRFGRNHLFTNELYTVTRAAISEAYGTVDFTENDKRLPEQAQALADLKFTYVVSCQLYGAHKKSKNTDERSCYTNILNLMLT